MMKSIDTLPRKKAKVGGIHQIFGILLQGFCGSLEAHLYIYWRLVDA